MTNYQIYAKVMLEGTLSNPNKWMLRPAIEMAHKIMKLCPPKRSVLDLGCGVGELTRLLSVNGYECFGVDLNSELIDVARVNNPDGRYWCQDFLQNTSFIPPASIVVATHEVFNMVEDWQSFLNVAARKVISGGVLIFDLITSRGFETWNDVQIQERSDFFMLQKCIYSEQLKRVTVKLTGFLQDGEIYRRFDILSDVFNHDITNVVLALQNMSFDVKCFPEWSDLSSSEVDIGGVGQHTKVNLVCTRI